MSTLYKITAYPFGDIVVGRVNPCAGRKRLKRANGVKDKEVSGHGLVKPATLGQDVHPDAEPEDQLVSRGIKAAMAVAPPNEGGEDSIGDCAMAVAPPNEGGGYIRPIRAAARRRIKSIAYLLESKYGRVRLGFLTVTLSPDVLGRLAAIGVSPTEVFNRFVKYLSRYWARKTGNKGFRFLKVIELHKDGRPHCHILFLATDSSGRFVFKVKEHDFESVLLDVLNSFSCFEDFYYEDVRSSCRAERLRRSVVRYLSKYLSKMKMRDTRLGNWFATDRVTSSEARDLIYSDYCVASDREVVSLMSYCCSRYWPVERDSDQGRVITGYFGFRKRCISYVKFLSIIGDFVSLALC